MNLIRRVSAIYKEQELPEYRGNPLIEALILPSNSGHAAK